MDRTRVFFMLCANVLLALALFACGATAADESSNAPGVKLTFEAISRAPVSDFADTRLSRLISLYVPQDSAPSPFTAAGAFRATFEGDISVRLRTMVRFSAEGRGKLTLSVGGKVVLETSGDDLSKTTSDEIRLGKGKNHLVAVYESPQAGDAWFRLNWVSRTWRAEPIPPMILSHPVADEGLRLSQLVREGRLLFARSKCAACHALGQANREVPAMPELTMDAPALAGLGSALNQEWIARWILHPRTIRAGTTMPELLHGPDAPQQAVDIAAYLASLTTPAPQPDASGIPKAGGQLLANLDCIACHTLPGGKTDVDRISLTEVQSKFTKSGLIHFLLNPQANYAWRAMPNFRLSVEQASDLAVFLLPKSEKHGNGKSTAGDPTRGKSLIVSSGCLNCHALNQEKSSKSTLAFAAMKPDWTERGCVAPKPDALVPDFALTAQEQSALVAFLKTGLSSLNRDAASEFAERQIAALRCTACHGRDGIESAIAQGLDAESQAIHSKFPNPAPAEHDLLAADQRPPILTWAGEKLRPQWMQHFVAGEIAYKPRPYLRARMPGFFAPAAGIAAGLAEEQGFAPIDPPAEKPDAKLAEIGRLLSGKVPNVGLSCVQCHAIAGQLPVAAFDAPAINFVHIAERIRHGYFVRWMHDPQRIDPNTKMPKFADDDNKTALPVFDNNADKQFDAIWNYLLEDSSIVPPAEQ
jgi:mono/diheme cytochrome c family protein